VTIAVCTGCRAIVRPGPYFQRRIVRHLQLRWHNHDAGALLGVSREKLGALGTCWREELWHCMKPMSARS
jgi:hypothetical protein